MRHAYAKRRDANEAEIVADLEAAGAFVYRLDLPVDLLVHFRERWYLLEVKSPTADLNRKDRAEQRAFCKAFDVPIVTTSGDALRAIGAYPATKVLPTRDKPLERLLSDATFDMET